MESMREVLVLGGTGRTGGRVVTQLLQRGVPVRAIVRSAARLPAAATEDPRLTVVEADVATLTSADLQAHLAGCDAVISCLGHTITLRGIFGPPRDLVTSAMSRVCEAVRAMRPARPVKLVLMSSVSVYVSDACDARRGAFERVALGALRAVMPPARDNQRAADLLCQTVGPTDPYIEWVAVRPDTLREGDTSPYAVHGGLVSSLAKPDDTTMNNVAHFMCELVTGETTWETWRGRLPVVVNTGA